jgi:oligoribonuclease NrnB/cAMP/cGMP phosphodiesterase (DHH superfamily)
METKFLDVALFTHGEDLDGLACAVVAKNIIIPNTRNYVVYYETYKTINDSIKIFIKDGIYKDCSHVIITDIGITKEVADMIDEIDSDGKFILIDHHDTNLFLNDYSWAAVRPKDYEDNPISAAKLLLQTFWEELNRDSRDRLTFFTSLVSDYDTYTWKEKNNMVAKELHDVCCMYPPLTFVNIMIERMKKSNALPFFTTTEEFAWKISEEKCNAYIKQKMDEMKIIHVKGFKVAFMFADLKEYVSALGNAVAEKTDVDLVAMADMGKREMSYRSIGNKIHLGKDFAALFGGGGHPNSAGSPITESVIENIIGQIFG